MTEESSNKHVLAVQALFVQHMPQIRAFVLSLMPDFSQVDDILQDAFLTVTAKAADFELGTNFKAWVFTIARYRVLKAMNAMEKAFLPLSEEVLESLMAAEPVYDDEAENRRLSILDFCMAKLAPRARQLIEMRYYDALNPAHIAQRLGMSVNGISVSLARSRQQLRRCIEKRMTELR